MKKCSHCKEIKPLSEFSKTKTNKDGLSYLCRPCNRAETKAYRERHNERYYRNQCNVRNSFTGRIKDMHHNCKTRAKIKGFDFDIEIDDIINLYAEQNGRCAITNQEMDFKSSNRKKANPFRISIDRIDSNGGYTKNNIRLVCWSVNQMKGDKTEEEFKFWIELLYKTISSQSSKEAGSETISKESRTKWSEAPSPCLNRVMI